MPVWRRWFPGKPGGTSRLFPRADAGGNSHNFTVPGEPTGRDPQTPHVLVIGYGNTLRGDDGVGPRVAERIEARHFDRVHTIACHQLTPELAEPISRARIVIFVDAAADLPEGKVRVSRVRPESEHQVMAHSTSPSGLLHLAEAVFDSHPTAWAVGIPVTEMGIGEELSEVARRGVERAVARIQELLHACAGNDR